MAKCVVARDLTKSFENLPVLSGLNLEVDAGERLILLGASGAGKTTLLRIIAGLDYPASGHLKVAAQRIGFVFQEPRLIPWRTVRENLLFVNRQGEADRLLEQLQLKGFENYYPAQLSGGMKQRVNLARALIIKPALLLLDEAFSSLDPPVKMSILDDLIKQWQNNRFTIISVTHDLKEGLYMADRAVILDSSTGQIGHDIKIDIDGQRSIFSPHLLQLEAQVLQLMTQAAAI
ncbi:MAG: ABC transporter ATP-binding protein [Syntrophomonadaceae bacterium]|jgi:NitT/TauT family transport system ATP-binding protein